MSLFLRVEFGKILDFIEESPNAPLGDIDDYLQKMGFSVDVEEYINDLEVLGKIKWSGRKKEWIVI